jgi:hypothetical protein
VCSRGSGSAGSSGHLHRGLLLRNEGIVDQVGQNTRGILTKQQGTAGVLGILAPLQPILTEGQRDQPNHNRQADEK